MKNTGDDISPGSSFPTFRGVGLLLERVEGLIDPDKYAEKIDLQVILTNTFYSEHPQKAWEWLRNFY